MKRIKQNHKQNINYFVKLEFEYKNLIIKIKDNTIKLKSMKIILVNQNDDANILCLAQDV